MEKNKKIVRYIRFLSDIDKHLRCFFCQACANSALLACNVFTLGSISPGPPDPPDRASP